MDTFDQLHVVSDLHLGGPSGRQIFNQGEALAAVIDFLAAVDRSQRVGLVLNGDIVDFLAVEGDQHAGSRYLDPVDAAAKLAVIMGDPAFRAIFRALAGFARTENRVLVLAMGNHDVELGLPEVRESLVAALAGDDLAARRRIVTVMDGAGYACRVGGAPALCVHGNEVDPWNVVDYEALRKIARARNRGRVPEEWEPNAGTRLVIDVMNGIKRRYPFVDLLKPETIAVPQVLLALPSDYQTSLAAFARSVGRQLFDTGRFQAGFLGGPGAGGAIDDRRALDQLIASGPLPLRDRSSATIDPLDEAAEHLERGTRPTALVDGSGERKLGLGGLLIDRLLGRDPRENLREALIAYAGSSAFALDGKDSGFDELDKAVSDDVRFLVAGHTHLERRRLRRSGPGVYYNSGTWIRLIHLTSEMLGDDQRFDPYFKALTEGTIEALDEATGVAGPLVLQKGTVVSIVSGAGGVRGELRNAGVLPGEKVPKAPEAPWRVVPNSGYPDAAQRA